MNHSRILSQAALVTGTLLFSLGVQTYAQTWSAPTGSPPNSNAYAPLNTSPSSQAKVGGLLLNTGGAINGLIVQNGNVGIGSLFPTSKLDVAGDIKIGNQSAACTTTNEGAQRYNSTSNVMEFCNGTAWTAFGDSARSCAGACLNGRCIPNDTTITCSLASGDGATASASASITNGQIYTRTVLNLPYITPCNTNWVLSNTSCSVYSKRAYTTVSSMGVTGEIASYVASQPAADRFPGAPASIQINAICNASWP